MQKAKNKVVLGLPKFIESYGKKFGTCFLCESTFTFTNNSASTHANKLKLLQKFYIRCLKAERHVNAEDLLPQLGVDDSPEDEGTLAFCEGCFDKIETLLQLYQKLVELELKFNQIRTEFVDVAIKSYVNQTLPAAKDDVIIRRGEEENAKQYWRKSIGLNVKYVPNWEQQELCKSEEYQEDANINNQGNESDSAMELMEEIAFEGIDISIIKEEVIEEEEYEFYQNEDLDLKDIVPDAQKDNIEDNLLNPVVRLEKLELTEAQKIQLEGLMSHSTVEDYDDFGNDMENYCDDTDFNPDSEDLEEEEYCPPSKLKKVSHRKVVTRRQALSTNDEESKPEIPVRKRKYVKKSKRAASEYSETADAAVSGDPCSSNGVQVVKKGKLQKMNCKGFKIVSREEGRDPKKKRSRLITRAQCDICEKIFNLKYIRLHIRVHTGEKPCQCPRCPKSFYKTSNLAAHLLTHTKEQRFQCDQCEGAFTLKYDLRAHQASKHGIFNGENVSECEICQKKFLLPHELKKHMKSKHGPNKKAKAKLKAPSSGKQENTAQKVKFTVQCKYCSKKFPQPYRLKRHLLTHTKETPFPCDQCGKAFSLKNTLRTHRAYVHKIFDRENVLKCEICQKKFLRPHELKNHMNSMHNPNKTGDLTCPENCSKRQHDSCNHSSTSKDYVCEICGKAFGIMQTLRNHIAVHGEKKLQCSYCPKRFHFRASLRLHLAVHTGQHYSFIKCKFCEESFPSWPRYRKHSTEKHPEEYLNGKLFVCKQVCHMNFGSESELAEHMISKHKNLKCQECDKYFQTKLHFRNHMLTHTGEQPHKCQICDKSFSLEVNLQEHVFRHTGERPFKCEKCDVGFLRNKEYRIHMESAHGEIIKVKVASAIRAANMNNKAQQNAKEQDNNLQIPGTSNQSQ